MQIQQAATKGSELSRQFITLGRKQPINLRLLT